MKEHARRIFDAAIRAVEPGEAVSRHVRRDRNVIEIGSVKYDLDNCSGVYVVGAGKANAPMAEALEEILGDALTGGVITVKYEHSLPLRKIQVCEAGHPVPDDNGMAGARAMLDLVQPLNKDALVFCLLSGGGSALMAVPAEGLTLADKQETTRLLLACGANIEEINAVRKHLSAIKGGQLARAASPATCINLILSDVVGDPLDAIASGPTVPDRTTFQDVLDIVSHYGIEEKLPARVSERIRDGVAGRIGDTPKSGDPSFSKTQNVIVGNNRQAIQAAATEAESLGYNTLILSSSIEGETDDVARVHAAIAGEIHESGNPVRRPACILSGGETTVTLKGNGKGGRNQEFALAAAAEISGLPDTLILSGGTDGTDGPTDAAGAFADGTTKQRAGDAGMKIEEFLNRNDSYTFFDHLDDLLKTGPTRTNVMDVRIVLMG
ncbi:MAG: glycerate kinase [Planctomycetota bacterium]|nr:glycerate kinase [Planctomycetota bacterium]MDA1142877.1 glycerate kinase [Planctomycetota bacterium]